jgi:sugar fermentation stimulation protein A
MAATLWAATDAGQDFLVPVSGDSPMLWPPLIPAVLLRRYQRFLADVRLQDGRQLTVHCPNTGAMTGCAEPGARVWLSLAANPARKYAHTWELVETATGLACIHSARANALVAEALAAGMIAELAGYAQWRREVRLAGGSRVDFQLEAPGRPPCLLEVKCVTLCRGGGLGLFPDAVSQRGTRHLRELLAARCGGARAVLLFCVQHSGIDSVAPADAIDPAYGEALRAAAAGGVELLAYRAAPCTREMVLSRPLPVRLGQVA